MDHEAAHRLQVGEWQVLGEAAADTFAEEWRELVESRRRFAAAQTHKATFNVALRIPKSGRWFR